MVDLCWFMGWLDIGRVLRSGAAKGIYGVYERYGNTIGLESISEGGAVHSGGRALVLDRLSLWAVSVTDSDGKRSASAE